METTAWKIGEAAYPGCGKLHSKLAHLDRLWQSEAAWNVPIPSAAELERLQASRRQPDPQPEEPAQVGAAGFACRFHPTKAAAGPTPAPPKRLDAQQRARQEAPLSCKPVEKCKSQSSPWRCRALGAAAGQPTRSISVPAKAAPGDTKVRRLLFIPANSATATTGSERPTRHRDSTSTPGSRTVHSWGQMLTASSNRISRSRTTPITGQLRLARFIVQAVKDANCRSRNISWTPASFDPAIPIHLPVLDLPDESLICRARVSASRPNVLLARS